MKYTESEWVKAGEKLYGADPMKWRFECPACHNVTSVEDFRIFKDKGATPDSAATECIGRYTGGLKGPNKCDWAAYGLFRGPDFVIFDNGEERACFSFAKPEL